MRKPSRTPPLPLMRGKKAYYPRLPVCPSCRRKRVFEPHSFAVLSAGALLKTGPGDTARPDQRMLGFLDLTWHGAHNGGSGKNADLFVTLPIARDVFGGQSEIYFCSTSCLHRFFGRLVQELQRRVDASARRSPRRKSRPRAEPR